MANTVKKLARTAIATTEGVVYTTPALTTAVVTNIILTNTTASVANLTVKLGGVEVISYITITGNGVFALDLKQVLNATDTIEAVSTIEGVKLHISGMEIA